MDEEKKPLSAHVLGLVIIWLIQMTAFLAALLLSKVVTGG